VEEKEDGLDLVFETIRKKNQGDYSCKASVRGQEVEKKFTLSVFSKQLQLHINPGKFKLHFFVFFHRAAEFRRNVQRSIRHRGNGFHDPVRRRRRSRRHDNLESSWTIPPTM
jgi:hypothetical protein